jgi:protein-S-isoprenylcysteine O-methyltransferase Ste14
MDLQTLVGAGHRVVGLTLPFAVVGVAANIHWPAVFRMDAGAAGVIAGSVLLALGVPLWLTSAVQILIYVPRKTLITRGPFALMRHPLYTSVALLVVPGISVLLDTWLGFALGAILYLSSRLFSGSEEKLLAATFPEQYPAYRSSVLLPWL